MGSRQGLLKPFAANLPAETNEMGLYRAAATAQRRSVGTPQIRIRKDEQRGSGELRKTTPCEERAQSGQERANSADDQRRPESQPRCAAKPLRTDRLAPVTGRERTDFSARDERCGHRSPAYPSGSMHG
jgi:hypothetical protein